MVLRVVLFAMMALGLGGFGLIAWVSTRPPAAAEAVAVAAAKPAEPEPEVKAEAPKPVVKVQVLVAGRAVRAGSLLKPEEITAREVPESAVPTDATLNSVVNRHSLVGAMVRRSLAAGEALVAGDLMRPGDHGFLAAVLGPGMRAVTIGVDAISGPPG